jgi:condensin complex subunit 2
VAKKVNIRLLKESLWTVLNAHAPSEPTPAGGAAQPAWGQQSFKAAMATLAGSSPPEQMKEVSVAYCFICLLHLANEQGLRVEGNSQLDDLTVSHAPDAAPAAGACRA